jgi:hypothetical protein
MNALEAAKALAKDDACFRDVIDDGTIVSRCVFCLWVPLHEGHHPDCEWPMLPQIVAALEAMTLLTRDENWSYGIWSGPGAEGDIARYALGLPIEDWSKEAIERALKGEVPT